MDQNLDNSESSADSVNRKTFTRETKSGQGRRSKKCNQCNFEGVSIWIHMKTHCEQKKINVTNVTMCALFQVTWGNI